MATLAELSFPATEIALADAVTELPGCQFRVEESAFPGEKNTVHVWITCDECSDIPSALEKDSSVESYECLVNREDEGLYALQISDSMLLPREIIQGAGGTVRAAYGRNGRWTLEVRFTNHEDIGEVDEMFTRYGIEVSYDSILRFDEASREQFSSLTDQQQEAIEMALEKGYYEIPRGITLAELAEELGISHQALSERMRRAQVKMAQERLTGGTTSPKNTE